MNEKKNKSKKRKGLDALRGVAIIGIVLYHCSPPPCLVDF